MFDLKRNVIRLLAILVLAGSACPLTALAAEPPNVPLVLDQAVALAVANNRLVRETVANSHAAEAAHRSARADLFPKASAEYGYTRFKEQPYMWVEGYQMSPQGTITGIQSYQKATSDKTMVKWNLTLTQPLFTGFALITRLKMAELGIKSSRVDEAVALQDVTKQAKLAFINVLLAEKLLTVAIQTEVSIASHARNAENFYDQGLIPYNDQLQSKVALADATQQRVAQAARREMAVASLNTVLDLPVEHPTRVHELADQPVSEPAALTGLMARALQRRPELTGLDLGRQQLVQGVTLPAAPIIPPSPWWDSTASRVTIPWPPKMITTTRTTPWSASRPSGLFSNGARPGPRNRASATRSGPWMRRSKRSGSPSSWRSRTPIPACRLPGKISVRPTRPWTRPGKTCASSTPAMPSRWPPPRMCWTPTPSKPRPRPTITARCMAATRPWPNWNAPWASRWRIVFLNPRRPPDRERF
nr:TolC family protein [Desulfosarcina cetonica]